MERLESVPSTLLTVEEAARSLRLGRSKTYQLISRGTLPSVQIDGSRRVRVTDLAEFVERLRGTTVVAS
jgi:excisionase family DNA binding protein